MFIYLPTKLFAVLVLYNVLMITTYLQKVSSALKLMKKQSELCFMNRKPYEFYDAVPPIKLTEARQIKLRTKGWGILTDYYLDSVKINNRNGVASSVATLRVYDKSGQITCVVRGAPKVGLLFSLSTEEWKDIENLCFPGHQLFYRNFKDGISKKFNYEQKLFYTFCATNQSNEPLVAAFIRCVNTRNNFKNDACIEIEHLQKCDDHLLDLYKSHLREIPHKNTELL